MRWSLAGLFACGLPVACADPCIDDGLGQQGEGSCPQVSASQTEGNTDSNGTETVTDTMGSATMGSNTEGMTGSQTSTETVTDTLDDTATATVTDTDTMGETETETAGGTLWCVDEDGDGFGDPDMCQQSDEPVPGSVDNDDDCDDSNENTFPGAAPEDDPRACMRDEDGDDWGDDNSGGDLPPGVEPGTDCLDDDSAIYPGTAENEDPPDLCAQDEDDDGWGDTDPPPGAEPGTDCDDSNPDIEPGAAENEPELCAVDQDDDGWGDDGSNGPLPPGVDAGSDCDDGNVYTGPGEAPLDDPAACMQDEDGDDWGDDNGDGSLPPGVVPGTDCDDTNPDAFPGAAPNENPPDLCTIDADGDGWGDTNPPGGGGGSGPQSGSDCYDSNPDLNPGGLQLTAFMPYEGAPGDQRTLQTVNPATAALGAFIDLEDAMGNNPNVNLVTATLRDDGIVLANNLSSDEIVTVDYADTCGMGTGLTTGLGPYAGEGDAIVCGLEFAGDGNLYGIDNNNTLITFDPLTGQDTGAIVITDGPDGPTLDISSCGMAYDCVQDRLLVANGIDFSIYSIDPVTGAGTLVRDLDPFFGPAIWTPVGLAWDPISRLAFLSTGPNLYTVDLDDAAAAPTLIGAFGDTVSNLGYMPVCGP